MVIGPARERLGLQPRPAVIQDIAVIVMGNVPREESMNLSILGDDNYIMCKVKVLQAKKN